MISAVIIFVRLAIASLRAAARFHRISPVSTSKSRPAAGGCLSLTSTGATGEEPTANAPTWSDRGPSAGPRSERGAAAFASRSRVGTVEEAAEPPLSRGQSTSAPPAVQTTATAAQMATTALFIGRVAHRSDQPGRDQADDQQRHHREDVEARVGGDGQGHGREGAAEDDPDSEQRGAEVRIHQVSGSAGSEWRARLAKSLIVASPNRKPPTWAK